MAVVEEATSPTEAKAEERSLEEWWSADGGRAGHLVAVRRCSGGGSAVCVEREEGTGKSEGQAWIGANRVAEIQRRLEKKLTMKEAGDDDCDGGRCWRRRPEFEEEAVELAVLAFVLWRRGRRAAKDYADFGRRRANK
ncbi:unnamed protein product [Lactuca saligna]|uniref:Uncharacterized protein n=1 Tax=Lactuca saligna TaxID=75948 RepID=A0AA35VRL8_LACSI|nr:unnamed protein product [Lactuca saligna]